MSTVAASRRSSSSSTAKRPAIAEGAGGPKSAASSAAQAKKRVALGNITNVAARGGRAVVGGSLGNVAPPTTSGVCTTLLYPSRSQGSLRDWGEFHAELVVLFSDP